MPQIFISFKRISYTDGIHVTSIHLNTVALHKLIYRTPNMIASFCYFFNLALSNHSGEPSNGVALVTYQLVGIQGTA